MNYLFLQNVPYMSPKDYENVTVSLVVEVAVTVYTLYPAIPVSSEEVTPPENVAVLVSGIFNMTIPDPPLPGTMPFSPAPPPPEPVFAPPLPPVGFVLPAPLPPLFIAEPPPVPAEPL
jgi:hypothetical protein